MKMNKNKKLSLTLLAAMFSLFIMGFSGAATAEAAETCAETLQVNGASESTAFTNCRAYEADAARWNARAAFFTNEKTNVQRAFEAEAARYTAMAAFYTNEETNVQRAFEAEAARYTGLAAFYAADGSATSQPVSADILVRNHNYYDNLWAARHGQSATVTDPTAEPIIVTIVH